MLFTLNANDLRMLFFDFFHSKEHLIVPSAPMVMKNDPTLMFTNAGMNQFKDIFLGNMAPVSRRVANSQKCLRVSGKHNDLEEVGHDTYHHTMFEMLGNWSFGDYFKKEAIEWAWEFLIKRLGLPEDRLYATIFEGSPDENVSRDNEAFNCWKSCFKDPVGRIIEGSRKDNFWEMGETGPCGPCSEIHVDIRDDSERNKIPGFELVNKGHPQVIEIWNLVFIQYNRLANGKLEQLPEKHVDTGMGFERLCMIVQGKKSNYDTDIFQSLINRISDITGKKYGVKEEWDIALRVISDHLRAIAFSIADGQMPSNNKAGYVIRRILRRAVRYGYNNLGTEEPFLHLLVPVLADIMGETYPELRASKDHISKVILEEETAFLKTLGKGLKLIEKKIEDLRNEGSNILPGMAAFELYDTFGFPIDLTQLILKENGMITDIAGFEDEMKNQKSRSREDAAVEAGDWTIIRETNATEFTGYIRTEDDVLISKYRKIKIRGKESLQIILDKTPFYAESGGQVGDTGLLISDKEKIVITDTIKENNSIIHLSNGRLTDPHARFRAVVDLDKRQMTANNHTATHLLHFALRSVLGKHVEQKGSLVTPDRLRFDFSHFTKITREELKKVEEIANRMVRQSNNIKVIEGVPMKEAIEMGATALFGEKYGSTVRVVRFGESIELCGGTHVENTGRIGFIKIVSEGGIAAGIRRIEAVTASKAEEYINEKLESLDEAVLLLKSSGNIKESIGKLLSENALLRKSVEKFEARSASEFIRVLDEKAVKIKGIRFLSGKFDTSSAEILKNIASQVRNSSDNTVLVLGSDISGKANILVMVSDSLVGTKKLNAAEIIKEIASEINGGGGGQPFLATAGGKKPAGIEAALRKAEEYLRKTVK
ncbi:MAG TPA: alanine--tRNA ligase [Bacteroidales bacterium]|nr:alanine--tRNA ligase [Bacteroidales bacterium]HBZ22403.1 alanine--tRNA ligase [Bacteroidales bacterium]